MKPVQAGKLRNRVQIQVPREVRDVYGEATLEWDNLGERWAEVVPFAGEESIVAGAVESRTSLTVRVRTTVEERQYIKPRARLILRNRVLNIESVRDLEERGRVLEIICREEVKSP